MRALAFLGCGLAAGTALAQPPPLPATPDETDADAELRRMAEDAIAAPDETVVIFDERPDKPFDRDTDVRLTGEDLAARGATDLASALRLLPDIIVRDGGRGGFNIDVRGGRKGAVTILIDGVSVSDPYYGTFDVSTIPITDIVQIRVSTNPQSPIDGPGGPGGVIEVLTRDAVGPQVVVARLTGDSLQTLGVTGTARAALSKHTAVRLSASGQFGSRDLPLPGRFTLDENRHASTGATRFEYREGDRRVVVDGFVDSRHYIAPPSDTDKSEIVLIDRELSGRVSAKADDKVGKLQLQGQLWTQYQARRSRHFSDVSLETESSFEDLTSTRLGGMALATHPIGKRARWALSMSANREDVRVLDEAADVTAGGATVLEPAADLQYELGRFRIDGAVGAAIPFGVEADPWPELKIAAKWRPWQDLELTATGGHKGRVPTLRERFDSRTGNPALDPEKVWHAELRGVAQLGARVKLEAAPFVRRSAGTIRQVDAPTDEDPTATISGNLGEVRFYGADTNARVHAHDRVDIGLAYNYIHARSNSNDAMLAENPLDRLPPHRVNAWLQLTPHPRIVLLGRMIYFGESIDRKVVVPGYTTFEATLTAMLSREYLAVLRVDDVTDVAPETRKSYHAPGRVISLVVQGTWE